MAHCGMRQVVERHVSYKVDLMVWSNRLDLLALSNFKGEVQVHRLQWQKVWNLSPTREDVTVKAMAWRPDGKALAIAYSSGIVTIVDIEDKEELETYELMQEEEYDQDKHGITFLTWATRSATLDSATEPNFYDDASIFLQAFPTSSEYKTQGMEENAKVLKDTPNMNQITMLVVGYGNGYIYMNIFGTYPFATIHLAQVAKDDFGGYKILDIAMSDDFSLMQVTYIDCFTNNLFVSLMNTGVLSAYADEMNIVAKKHSEIGALVGNLDQTMTLIIEAWEHILLEMDTKMAEYAASVPEGGVSADLLELLMMGTPSDELELCLLQKLTVNDLKKFSNSIELSYSTIQKLVLKQLNIVGHSLTYYLSELRGLTRIHDRYKILGLDEADVTHAIKASYGFLNKCLELQQVIDTSMRNYKAFLRWLFVVIIRLNSEQTPTEIVKITQQELGHIAEFLYNFDNVQVESSESLPDKPVKFNLERLGQYLEDEELTILPDDEDNPWHKFLKDNSCLIKDNDTIFSTFEFRKFSLVQQQNYLKGSLAQLFDIGSKDTWRYFSLLYTIKSYEDPTSGHLMENLRICQTYNPTENKFLVAFVDATRKTDGICFMSVNIKEKACTVSVMKYHFSSSLVTDKNEADDNLAVVDLQFYSPEYLSVLAENGDNEESCVFIQVPTKVALENSHEGNIKSKSYIFNSRTTGTDISPLLEAGVYKVLEKMDGFRIAVSGGRKVAVVLAKCQRKVRVFDMEVDGEDGEDETLDTTPQSLNATDQSATTTGDVTF